MREAQPCGTHRHRGIGQVNHLSVARISRWHRRPSTVRAHGTRRGLPCPVHGFFHFTRSHRQLFFFFFFFPIKHPRLAQIRAHIPPEVLIPSLSRARSCSLRLRAASRLPHSPLQAPSGDVAHSLTHRRRQHGKRLRTALLRRGFVASVCPPPRSELGGGRSWIQPRSLSLLVPLPLRGGIIDKIGKGSRLSRLPIGGGTVDPFASSTLVRSSPWIDPCASWTAPASADSLGSRPSDRGGVPRIARSMVVFGS